MTAIEEIRERKSAAEQTMCALATNPNTPQAIMLQRHDELKAWSVVLAAEERRAGETEWLNSLQQDWYESTNV